MGKHQQNDQEHLPPAQRRLHGKDLIENKTLLENDQPSDRKSDFKVIPPDRGGAGKREAEDKKSLG